MVVCCDCGCVVEDRVISEECEWRTFTTDSTAPDESRVGRATDSKLSAAARFNTNIATSSSAGDASLARAHAKSLAALKAADKQLLRGYAELDRLRSLLLASDAVVAQAKEFFGEVSAKLTLRGPRLAAMCGAALFLSFKKHRQPRLRREIARAAKVPERLLNRFVSHAKRTLGLHLAAESPADVTKRFASLLSLPSDACAAAVALAQCLSSSELSERRKPSSIAAAALFCATSLVPSLQRHTLSSVSATCGVSVDTAKDVYAQVLAGYRAQLERELRDLLHNHGTSLRRLLPAEIV